MTDDLISLGLHKELLDGLGDSMIKRLFHLIGWAAPVYTERSINAKKKSKSVKKKS